MSNYGKTPCCEDKQGDSQKEIEDSDNQCCGGYPDESTVSNPETPKLNADNDFFKEFEEMAYSMGVVEIASAYMGAEITDGTGIQFQNAVVLTFKMDNEIIKTPAGEKAQQLNEEMYAKFAKITYRLSDFLRSNGYATQVAHPHGDLIDLSKLGQEAGLGWIGKHGLLITPKLGPLLKVSAIFTSIKNLPENTGVDHSWIDEYCERCNKCTIACPENAMVKKIHPNGEKETIFHPELCIGCSKGCTSCIGECVFYKRGYDDIKRISDKLKERMLKKKQNPSLYHLKKKKR